MFFYIIERIQSKNDTINHTHDAILGKQCQIMSLEVGQRGWLLVDVGDKTFGPHRIALSNTLRISDDPDICIETENTFYYFKRIASTEGEIMIIKNAIRCIICGDEIESKHRHDYVECKCGACAVDGGHDYLRRCFKEEGCYTDISIIDHRQTEE